MSVYLICGSRDWTDRPTIAAWIEAFKGPTTIVHGGCNGADTIAGEIAAFFGTVDRGYRGEVGVTLQNHGQQAYTVHPGDEIAQLEIAPVARAEVLKIEELTTTERGADGFGSTGVR